eukprot:Gb_13315 [translate_table: standard]
MIMPIVLYNVKVDFTDKETYEYLFKDYWLEVKDRHSLTLAELQKAQSPLKVIEGYVKDDVDSNKTSEEDDVSNTRSDETSDWMCEESYNVGAKRRRRPRTVVIPEEDSVEMENEIGRKDIPMERQLNRWASKELVEFIEFINEDTNNVFSENKILRLLLKYIVQNKLEDRRKKGQIICDEKLRNLFGRSIIRRFEISKLLESHFGPKQGISKLEDPRHLPLNNDDNWVELDDTKEKESRSTMDKRWKSQMKANENKVIKADPNDYAAISVHNIRLVYLQQALLEDLLEDLGSFNNKVVGSFVRIGITEIGKQQGLCYHLVQVVGTKKVQEAYNTGRRMTDVILEILNFNKQEDVSIDAISNQDFTEGHSSPMLLTNASPRVVDTEQFYQRHPKQTDHSNNDYSERSYLERDRDRDIIQPVQDTGVILSALHRSLVEEHCCVSDHLRSWLGPRDSNHSGTRYNRVQDAIDVVSLYNREGIIIEIFLGVYREPIYVPKVEVAETLVCECTKPWGTHRLEDDDSA